ncbi:MAG: PQQ-binding-like beta-propeller repeat protein [Gemmataceae bacterium]
MKQCVALVAVFFLLSSALIAAEPSGPSTWPQFRGPTGQGIVEGKLPTTWAEGKNVAWKTPIPGKGWSSPVIGGGHAWLTTAVSEKGGSLSYRILGIDLQTGDVKHNVELFASPKGPTLHARNTAASPTPVIIGDHVIASFGGDGIGCIHAKSGELLWKNSDLKVNYLTGPASSPAPYKDMVIIPCDGADAQFAVALEAATGKQRWKTERPIAATRKSLDERRAFSSPLIITVGKQDQVVMPGSHCVYSYDPNSGEELWRVRYTGFSNVPRPVFADGLVFVTSGFANHEMMAIRPDGKGDVTDTHVVWKQKKAIPNIPSPVVVGDRMYLIGDKGVLSCLDLKTGAQKWTERISGSFSASPLVTGNTIYLFSDEGFAVVFEAGDAFKQMARNELTGRIQATPAVVDGSLILRTDANLYRINSTK